MQQYSSRDFAMIIPRQQLKTPASHKLVMTASGERAFYRLLITICKQQYRQSQSVVKS